MATGVDVKAVVDRCRAAFNAGKVRSYESRLAHIYNVMRMVTENKQAFIDALYKDLRKPEFEAVNFELDLCLNECVLIINELKNWMKPEKVAVPLAGVGKQCYIKRDPLGVILIISAWNYPFQLAVHGIMGAIAAGNTVVVKPSELGPACSKLLEELFPKYLDQDCFQILNGDVAMTTALLEQKFDHILFTGSSHIGKIIQAAAAKHLTPVTLELGGKSPLFIDTNCNIDVAIHRTASAKFYNSGQTCVAPDYIICHSALTDRVVASIRKAVKEFYGQNPKDTKDYGRMVNARHFNRVCALLEGQEIAIGGETDEADLYIAPTVVVNVKDTDKIMQEEIFGPVWPIFNIDSVDEAIKFINSRDKPLALYVFSNNGGVIQKFQNETSSGAICGNECFVHGGIETLPFGGVGASGMGCYHGKFTFETFSHRKACLVDSMYTMSELARGLFYPPFTARKASMVAWLMRKRIRGGLGSTLLQLAGIVLVLAVIYKVFFS